MSARVWVRRVGLTLGGALLGSVGTLVMALEQGTRDWPEFPTTYPAHVQGFISGSMDVPGTPQYEAMEQLAISLENRRSARSCDDYLAAVRLEARADQAGTAAFGRASWAWRSAGIREVTWAGSPPVEAWSKAC